MGKETTNIELAVVGGGPAGLAAAVEAASYGVQVTVFDENERPGGQLFKQIHKFFGSKEHQAGIRGHDIGYSLLSQCEKLGVKTMLSTVVWGIEKNMLGIQNNGRTYTIKTKKTIIATGASENPLCFPGWTLSGVMGAGAAQTMMNVHRVQPGRKALMVGSGNVGLIVSYQLLLAGIKVIAIVETLPKIGGYMVHAAKIRRAGVPILTSTTICEVRGENEVEKAIIASVEEKGNVMERTQRVLPVDLICIAVGLRPLAELCWMTGCNFMFLPLLGGHVPVHDENMRTTVKNISVAGDVAGVEEASTAMEEGHLAGVAVAQELGYLGSEEAEEKKNLIRKRLKSLRLGPFGDILAEAKRKLTGSEVNR